MRKFINLLLIISIIFIFNSCKESEPEYVVNKIYSTQVQKGDTTLFFYNKDTAAIVIIKFPEFNNSFEDLIKGVRIRYEKYVRIDGKEYINDSLYYFKYDTVYTIK